jgi:hypothetical protein
VAGFFILAGAWIGATGSTGLLARIQNTATFSRDQSFFFVPFVNLSEAGVNNSSVRGRLTAR